MSEGVLRLEGVTKAFGDLVVLDGIDLDIPMGAHTTVIGRSGIGKSVLLKCVAGLLPMDRGRVRLLADGDKPSEEPPSCGYMFQQNALFDSLTVTENVALPLMERGRLKRKQAKRRAREMLEKLDLADAAGKYPAEISGGMQKRVALGRALITKPEIILFDEPTTGKYDVFNMIRRYRQRFGFTVLMVSHDVPDVFEITDWVAWLEGGKIAYWGRPEELQRNPPQGLKSFLKPSLATA